MKRILIIQENGHHDKNRNFRECFCLKRGFEHHGVYVDIWGKGHDDFDPNPDRRMYDQYFSHFDLVFAIENWDWMPDVSRIHTKKFIWAIDAHCKGPLAYEQYGFDKVLHATPSFAKEGCWLPNCYDDTIVKPLNIEKNIPIGFCGNLVNRKGYIDFLSTNIPGFIFDEFVIGDDMVKAVNSYMIHWNANIGVDINYRNFETMGCGTTLLTSHNPYYINLGMINGENCLIWNNLTELSNIASYAIKNKEWRDQIAHAGYQLVVNNHTYKNRAQTILEMI